MECFMNTKSFTINFFLYLFLINNSTAKADFPGCWAPKDHVPSQYRPLVIITYTGRNTFQTVKNPFYVQMTDPLWLIQKNIDGTIDVEEFAIKKYPGSAVFKNPFFRPEKNFRSIVPSRRYKKTESTYDLMPPLIQQYAQFLENNFMKTGSKRDHAQWLTQLYFYAKDADLERQKQNPIIRFYTSIKHLFGHYEKSTATRKFCKSGGDICGLGRETDGNTTTLNVPQAISIKNFNEPHGFETLLWNITQRNPFEYTATFVDPSVTLEDLHKEINQNIILVGDIFYLFDMEGLMRGRC
jgi:hypothetical protein